MGIVGGSVCVGTVKLDAALNIDDPGFQMYIRNDTDGDANDWYIGASNSNWAVGDHQLLFSPTSSSNDAVLRLLDVDDNDGTEAPVMIYTTYDQTLLLDGNEIDTRGTPLYINHNTDENTLINPSGGRVGMGTTNPQAMLHVVTSGANALSLQHDNSLWHLSPNTFGNENLDFIWANTGVAYAEINGVNGHWEPLSDRRYKHDIIPLGSVMDNLKNLNTYSYNFIHDETEKTHIGIIAQEAEKLFPEIVVINDGQYGVAYAQLAVIGVRAIQEQQVLIDSLKEKLALLKSLKKEGATEAGKVTVD
jgi:nuclear transport factor 2 (NTF2) superfamily protein